SVRQCPKHKHCRARLGCEGPSGAHVVIGTHANAVALANVAGLDALVIIDEPPSLVTHLRYTLDEDVLDMAQAASGCKKDAIECARRAVGEDATSDVPPLPYASVVAARKAPQVAEQIGAASLL